MRPVCPASVTCDPTQTLTRCFIAFRAATSDDKKLQSTLKKLNVNNIPGVEEVNMIKGMPDRVSRWFVVLPALDGQTVVQVQAERGESVCCTAMSEFLQLSLRECPPRAPLPFPR